MSKYSTLWEEYKLNTTVNSSLVHSKIEPFCEIDKHFKKCQDIESNVLDWWLFIDPDYYETDTQKYVLLHKKREYIRNLMVSYSKGITKHCLNRYYDEKDDPEIMVKLGKIDREMYRVLNEG